jgi:hypothetical protein
LIATSPGAVVYPVKLVQPVVDYYFGYAVTDPRTKRWSDAL